MLIRLIAFVLKPLDKWLYNRNPYPETWVQSSRSKSC